MPQGRDAVVVAIMVGGSGRRLWWRVEGVRKRHQGVDGPLPRV